MLFIDNAHCSMPSNSNLCPQLIKFFLQALQKLYKNGESRKPEKRREESVPKYASTPGRIFKDFVYSRGGSTDFKDFNYSNWSAMPNDARTPGRDSKDCYYSKPPVAATTANSPAPAPRHKSVSGQLQRKPPAEERKLECTLEELCSGCIKEIKFTRDVVGKNG